MTVTQIIADLRVDDLDEARRFYVDGLGLTEQPLGLDWVTRFVDPGTGAAVQVLTRDATAPEDPAASVKVDDVHATYASLRQAGYEIVHPLTTEPWGVVRFFVRTPDGTVLNIVQHHT
ncbi:VOC family protein [Occultella aeris]|uniref:Glyoxalase-like domain protein n=1 Tax=Occultella aeris TaxID=2761496 RepID=A0A7M4DNG4_9MICO|nr:VOC family protein [Occultella aeris]VZO38977.1 Glyoxalase-like domain protein [Occultella aeris]